MSQQMPGRLPGGGIDLSHLASQHRAPQPSGVPGGAAAAPSAAAGQAGVAQPGGPQGQTIDVPSLVMDVGEETFEQVAQLSGVVPVVFELRAEWSEPSKALSPVLEEVTREFDGRLMLARVDVDANPALAQAFQAQSVPTVVAMVAARPVPLFQGDLAADQVRQFFAQLLQLAEQNGVSGRVNAPDIQAEGSPAAPAEPEIPEAHRAAVDAAERGDFAAAVTEWEAVLSKAPADAAAREALVQMKLLQRLHGHTADELRSAAAAAPSDVTAQMGVADLDVSGGHVEDAFLRLLELFAATNDADERSQVRERLLELFEVVGVADPRVIAARGRLANLLY